MVYEHEIPEGSRLYFGKSAKIKRKIEDISSAILEKDGFEEIVTPYFSYHQHESINTMELIRFSDNDNHLVSMRADSTLDVVRLVTRRLGRTTEHKKWFYVQPIFKYPNTEQYQIGGELLSEGKLELSLKVLVEIFNHLKLEPLLQISNINIAKIISEILNIPLSVFKEGRLEIILKQKELWLKKLATLQHRKDIDEVIDIVPNELKDPLIEMKAVVDNLNYSNIIFAPLYYSSMRYYDKLFFRFIKDNMILARGGCYEFEDTTSSGFGLYTDALVENLIKQEELCQKQI